MWTTHMPFFPPICWPQTTWLRCGMRAFVCLFVCLLVCMQVAYKHADASQLLHDYSISTVNKQPHSICSTRSISHMIHFLHVMFAHVFSVIVFVTSLKNCGECEAASFNPPGLSTGTCHCTLTVSSTTGAIAIGPGPQHWNCEMLRESAPDSRG